MISYGIKIPILRPLIGFDKQEITNMAKKIGTFKESRGKLTKCPFVPRHPKTKADISKFKEIYREIGGDRLGI